MKPWSRAALLALACIGAACGEGAKLVQVTENGGTVTYPYKGNDYMVSSFRSDAFQLMDKRCAGAYSIVKEGEAKGRSRIEGAVQGAEEVIREQRWGIQFRCK